MSHHPPPPGMTASPYGYPNLPPPPASLRGLATALTVLLLNVAGLLLGNAAALFYRASLLAGAAEGRAYAAAQADLADGAVAATGLLYVALAIATAVVFIVWQFRHARNARVLGARGLGPGWAIGGWFIPVGNLVLPAVQIFQASRAADPETRRRAYKRGAPIVVWWALALGLGSVLVSRAVGMWPDDLVTTADLAAAASSDNLEGVSSLLLILAAVLAVVMVNTLSRRQEAALARLGQPLSPPTTAMGSTLPPTEEPWAGPWRTENPHPGSRPADPPAGPWQSPS
jgi:hypothetical protein